MPDTDGWADHSMRTCVLCGHFMKPGEATVPYAELHVVHKECAEDARAEGITRPEYNPKELL